MSKTIRVYACGGTGVNIGLLIQDQISKKVHDEDNTPFAKIDVVLIDTSESNIRDVNTDNIYLFEGVDGSGSDRTRNKPVIQDSIPDILLKYPPGDLSIVIHSTSGGSGSTAGPMIASALLKQKKLVICAATQTYGNLKHLKNTVSVLDSFESIALARERVLPVLLCDNTVESEANVNTTIANTVQMLAILFSGQLNRLDGADLDNWINFNNVTSHEVGAVLLDLSSQDTEREANKDLVCSVVTIANNPDSKINFGEFVEYHKVGLMPGQQNNEFKGKAFHFALIDGPIQRAHAARKKDRDNAITVSESRKKRISIASGNADDDGVSFD